jgi:hypothetical protein
MGRRRDHQDHKTHEPTNYYWLCGWIRDSILDLNPAPNPPRARQHARSERVAGAGEPGAHQTGPELEPHGKSEPTARRNRRSRANSGRSAAKVGGEEGGGAYIGWWRRRRGWGSRRRGRPPRTRAPLAPAVARLVAQPRPPRLRIRANPGRRPLAPCAPPDPLMARRERVGCRSGARRHGQTGGTREERRGEGIGEQEGRVARGGDEWRWRLRWRRLRETREGEGGRKQWSGFNFFYIVDARSEPSIEDGQSRKVGLFGL